MLLFLFCLLASASAFPKPPVVIKPVWHRLLPRTKFHASRSTSSTCLTCRVQLNPADPDRLPPSAAPPRVLVVGGGLAGLSAALELAERGYHVVIREASAELGGRLHTKRVEVEGVGQFRVEHGTWQ